MTTRKRNNTQRRGASSKAARMKVANVKRMFMAFLWLAIVVGLEFVRMLIDTTPANIL